MMSKRKIGLILLITGAILVYSHFGPLHLLGGRAEPLLPDVVSIDGKELANLPPVDVAIKFFQGRIKNNQDDVISYTLLGESYLRQARETGDIASYQRAQASLEKALDLLPGYSPASAALAAVHYAQHNFVEATELAGQVYQEDPRITQALATLGDAHLALGNYQKAKAAYQELAQTSLTPPVRARLAHLAELKGNTEEALQLMQRAADEALKSGASREGVAWYLLRLGDLYFNTGHVDEAGQHYEAALRVFDDYYLGLAGLGKVRAAQGDYEAALDLYERATAIIPQPEFLAALGDVYAITGQSDKARFQYDTVEYIGKLGVINWQVYNRQLANFYSDHDMHLDEALRLALTELEFRKDIYGYDAAAWACYKNGQYEKARQLIEHAMRLGTRDAKLYYHAGMIARAQSRTADARRLLSEALAINPHFDLLQARIARSTLDTLYSASQSRLIMIP
jgi:tetratricopeptide (TPR) repeat protein